MNEAQAFDLITAICDQTDIEEIVLVREVHKSKSYAIRIEGAIDTQDMMALAALVVEKEHVFGIWSDGVLIE